MARVILGVQGLAERWAPGLVNLPLLPGLACSIHATWGPPFSRALYLVAANMIKIEAPAIFEAMSFFY